MHAYETVIVSSWGVFILVWMISAFNVKRDIRGRYANLWGQYWLLRIIALAAIVLAIVRIKTGPAHSAHGNAYWIFNTNIFHVPAALGLLAAILSVIGVAFAIWARFNLGRNWSPVPSVKKDHELVTTGPYAYVRHPIYSGMLLAAFATALTGRPFGLIVFVFASLLFVWRIHIEEKIMLELFPNEYPSYQARTKRLIPLVW